MSEVDGFPYTFSPGQKKTTIFQMRSASSLRVANTVLISAGTEPATFVHEANGSHATGPTVLSLINVEMRGRYAFTGTPRTSVWIENGDLQVEGCSVDGGDTSNITTAPGTNLYYDSANRTPAGVSINGTFVGDVVARIGTFHGNSKFTGNATDVFFALENYASGGRDYNFASGAPGSGNGVGFYLYDRTARARRWLMDATGKFTLDGGLAVAGVITAATVAVLADDATPSVSAGNLFKTGGPTGITHLDGGVVGQTVRLLAAHAITMTMRRQSGTFCLGTPPRSDSSVTFLET